MPEAWIVDAVRSVRGRGKPESGGLSGIHPQELMAQVLNACLERTGIAARDVEDVVLGCVSQAGEQGGCIARMSVLAAGWPNEATGVVLNRFCGSGQQAVNFAAMGVLSGQQQLAIGGGVESMSRQPMGSDKAGLDGHNRHLRQLHPIVPQGISADLIATLEGFSREDCDRFAVSSQERCARALAEGRFAKSTIAVRDLEGNVALDREEHPRPGTTLESLSRLEPSFAGAAGYVQKGDALSFAQKVKQVYPQVERRCLERAGMEIGDIDRAEVNEAFAAIPLKVIRDLGLDPEFATILERI